MNEYYDEQQYITKRCVEDVYQKDGVKTDNKGVLNIDVSFDGTWMTKGHKSHIGAAFVMDVISGMTIDYEVLSNFCRSCAIMQKKKDKKAFEEWRKTVHVGTCQKHFDGKSGSMEPVGAERIWGRSQDKGFRYVSFIGDGDSSSYKTVCNMQGGKGPYSDAGINVVKEECINHVQKRMGTRLRKLKEQLKEDKKTKSGKVIKRSL